MLVHFNTPLVCEYDGVGVGVWDILKHVCPITKKFYAMFETNFWT